MAETKTNSKMPAAPAIFTEIEVLSLRDKVISALKEAFFSRTLKPGDPIVERELARQMRIGTPAVREALITLQEQGFVRRVANTATYVQTYSADEVSQLYMVRIETETLALQWAKPRATESDLQDLMDITAQMVKAGERKRAIDFYEHDLRFHRRCWEIAANKFLARCLELIVPPLFAFVLNASEETVTEDNARAHYHIVDALRNLDEPEFSRVIRGTLGGFTRWGVAAFGNSGRPEA
ncbi:MAG: GntR family transcriptional regulator [Acidobacteria bacterium]|nr:GntR family transcriptional regulator [Acidobacteriota bacterium]